MFKLKNLPLKKDTVEVSREWLRKLHHIALCDHSYSRAELVAFLESLDLILEGGLSGRQ